MGGGERNLGQPPLPPDAAPVSLITQNRANKGSREFEATAAINPMCDETRSGESW